MRRLERVPVNRGNAEKEKKEAASVKNPKILSSGLDLDAAFQSEEVLFQPTAVTEEELRRATGYILFRIPSTRFPSTTQWDIGRFMSLNGWL